MFIIAYDGRKVKSFEDSSAIGLRWIYEIFTQRG